MIASANARALLLRNELQKGWFVLYVTLTYDNEHLPVVFYNDNKIYRCPNGKDLVLVDEVAEPLTLYPCDPVRFPFVDCTGVIYYRDFQNFIKRFRRKLSYHGYGNFKYFICCEYGTLHHRPHAHILFFFEPKYIDRRIEDYLVECWKMCDKDVLRKGIETADAGVSAYLAAYVNSNSKHYSLAQHPIFKQKTRRSASSDYGCTFKDKEEIKRLVRFGLFDGGFDDGHRPFEYFDQNRLGRFSACFVSQRVFYTYFRKCYGFSKLSPNALCLRLRRIYQFCTWIKPWREDKPFHYSIDDSFHQADFNFYRGYLCYLDLMGYDDTERTFEFYLWLYPRMIALYQSQVQRRWMMNYEIQTPNNYFLDAYNTEFRSIGSSSWYDGLLVEFEVKDFGPFSADTQHELASYKLDYGKRLLPKHRNSLYNINF